MCLVLLCLSLLCLAAWLSCAPTNLGRYMWLECKPNSTDANCLTRQTPLATIPSTAPQRLSARGDIARLAAEKLQLLNPEEELGSGKDSTFDEQEALGVKMADLYRSAKLQGSEPEEVSGFGVSGDGYSSDLDKNYVE
uniref:Serglycin n=1 Tax=Callorhinchus milii TaxID=7868 RepID=A0A4W3JPB1_CALMI